MGYIITLLFIIGAIFSFTLHVNPLTGLINKGKATITEYLIPKTQTEIIIENLNPQRRTLEQFFTQTIPHVLESQITSPQERKDIEEAVTAFQQSEQAIVQIKQAERSETSIVESIVKKMLLNDSPSVSIAPIPSSLSISSTPLPPQCHIECN